MSGYAEAYVAWSLADPSNHAIALRAFDDRHDAFTLSSAVLDAQLDEGGVLTRVALQAGAGPAAVAAATAAQPAPGYAAGRGTTWAHLQQAYAGLRVAPPVTVIAGVFLSPLSPESLAVKDQWTWSYSTLFYGLPAYHVGVRATYAASPCWSFTGAVVNGWNADADLNRGKSVLAQATYAGPALAATVQYLGGPERPAGAAEGQPWRHLVDAYATWTLSPRAAVIGHVDAGLEDGALGATHWLGAAAYARYAVAARLALAARLDGVREARAGAAPIFVEPPWVGSATVTLDYRPVARASLRLEVRHDQAARDAFFGGAVGSTAAGDVPNRRAQDTVLLGLTSWFGG